MVEDFEKTCVPQVDGLRNFLLALLFSLTLPFQNFSHADEKAYCQYFDKTQHLMGKVADISFFLAGIQNFSDAHIEQYQDKLSDLKTWKSKFETETKPFIDEGAAKIHALVLKTVDLQAEFLQKIIREYDSHNLDVSSLVPFAKNLHESEAQIYQEMENLKSQHPSMVCGPHASRYLPLVLPLMMIFGVFWFFLKKR